VCEEIDMYKDSPEDAVHEILQKKIWKKQPLGYLISGKKKNVNGFTASYIREYMDKYYVGENIVVSVAGNFKKKETLSWIKEAFYEVKSRGEAFIHNRIIPTYNTVSFVKEKDIEQLHMNLAFKAPSFMDEDRYAAVILNNILGSDVNSRLFQTVRENNGLTYSVCSYPSSFSDTGLLHIYAAMNETQYKKVYSLIEDIIYKLNEKGITVSELNDAKKQTIVEMTLSQDSTASRMSANAKRVIYNVNNESFDERIKRINDVTKSDVNKLIRKYLKMEEMSKGIIGPMNLNI
jgi:predicted Zn-dependent peptidase